MKRLVIDAAKRTGLTKGEHNKIRKEGGVMAVLYGRKVDTTPIYIPAASLKKILNNGHGLVDVNIWGNTMR